MIPKIAENFNLRFLNKAKMYFIFGETPKSELNGKSTLSCDSPRCASEEEDGEDGIDVTDKRISRLSFGVSLLVFTIFMISQHTNILRSMLARVAAIAWEFAILLVSLSWLLVPLVSALMATVVTFTLVYVDSHTPGIFPPSPMSSARSQRKDGIVRQFHSSYILALAVGPIVGFSVYYRFFM